MTKVTEWVIPVEDPNNPKPAGKASKDNELQMVLGRTAANEVTVKLSQVVELIGEVKANELALFSTRMATGRLGRVKANSMIPQSRQTESEAVAMFFRKDLLNAINEAQGQPATPPPANLPNGEPNAEKLKAAKNGR